MTNVLRHSGAGRVRIVVTDTGGELELLVEDDGVGAPQEPRTRMGGLDGVRDRLLAAGGRVETTSSGAGFRLTASVPRGSS